MGVKHYDKSFKEQAVKLSQQRGNVNAVARELGVSSSQLSKWCSDVKVYKEQSFPGRGIERLTDEQREIKELKKALKDDMAGREMERIGMIDRADILDAVVVRMPKAYPAYFGTYARMNEIREWTDRFENLFLVGRNGMHRYNNLDHSMLTSMAAVDNILGNTTDKTNIWQVNSEEKYHESK